MHRVWTMLAVITLICLCLSTGCKNPLVIDRDTEIAIGRQGAADLEARYGVSQDPAMQARLDAIGRRLAAVSRDPSLPWTFKILDSPEVNAVCLPGGFIYVFRGMMEYVRDEDQLAGVVGHEIVHADHRHAKEAIEKAMTQSLLVQLVTRRSSEAVHQAAAIALDLDMRQGYREKEYEADRVGTEYAFRAGYRATGLRDLLSHLHEREGDPARITWLLQTHPPLSRRIERLNEHLLQLTGRPPAGR